MRTVTKACIGVVVVAGIAALVGAGLRPEQPTTPATKQPAAPAATQPVAPATPQPAAPAATQPTASAAPAGPTADTSYAIGFDIGREVEGNLKRDGVGISMDQLVKGFEDAVRGNKPTMSPERITKLLADLQATLDDDRTKKKMEADPAFNASAAAAATMSKTFMEKFSQVQGVQPLSDGIFYLVKKTGAGDPMGNSRAAVVNYQAFLSKGGQIADKQGAEVVLANLLPGAQTVLRKMKPGDRWYVAIPPEQAFGGRGQPPNIGPNEALVIDVELLEIKK